MTSYICMIFSLKAAFRAEASGPEVPIEVELPEPERFRPEEEDIKLN